MILALFVVLLFLYGVVSGRLDRTVVTPPIFFTAAGILAALAAPSLDQRRANPELLLHVAETGLVLLLFTDASHTDLALLRSIRNLPARLLTTGMLLTLALGAVGALVIFPAFSVWEAGILSAILAPTDAGLGQVVVTSERVPMRIRQALNVEAGLNDGLSVPFLLFFLALARADVGGGRERLGSFIVEQLGYGTAIGLAIGFLGGWALGRANHGGGILHSFRPIAIVALPILCIFASEAAAASMFIAAFVCGLAVQVGFPEAGRECVEFIEEWGQVFNLFVFFLFGLLVARVAGEITGAAVVYALLSLTVVRMLPVAIALLGTGLSRATVVFMGWFGPRGLASIVLGLVYLEGAGHAAGERAILLAVVTTVLLSVALHGFSARPGIGIYARSVAALPPDAPELQ